MAKWLGAPLGSGTTATTRAKDSDRQDACQILDDALVVSAVLGVCIGWGVYGNTGSPLDFTSDPGAKPDRVAPVG